MGRIVVIYWQLIKCIMRKPIYSNYLPSSYLLGPSPEESHVLGLEVNLPEKTGAAKTRTRRKRRAKIRVRTKKRRETRTKREKRIKRW